jgi:hypothetical protein
MPSFIYQQELPEEVDFDIKEDVIDMAQAEYKKRSTLHLILLAAAAVGTGYLLCRYQGQIIGAVRGAVDTTVETARKAVTMAEDSLHDMGTAALGRAEETFGILDV